MGKQNPTKLCECGCGQPTNIAKRDHQRSGHVRGQPVRFIKGHHSRKHGHTRLDWQSPTYKCWIAMLLRCENQKHGSYASYGGNGITVCDRWHIFDQFLADMGERPSKNHSLDRYPNQRGNYEPGNVRWATKIEQANNTKANRLITAFGSTNTVAEWARKTGIKYITLCGRLRRWPIEQAISRPLATPPTVCKHGHPRSPDNLYIYTDKFGRTRRVCKSCSALKGRRKTLKYRKAGSQQAT